MNKKLTWLILVFILVIGPDGFAQQRKSRKKMGNLTLQKLKSRIPPSKKLNKKKVKARNVGLIKPPSTNRFFMSDIDPRKAEYNRLVDEEIKRLYSLSRKFKRSRSRGEIWLRLGERYVEKAQIIDFKLQDKYDKQLKAYQTGKTKRKPRPPSRNQVRNYHKRAIKLYEWFVRDFPKDRKVAQALYFLGYNNFEIGNLKKGEEFYVKLTRRHPKSVYVSESHFALGEFYFEKEQWKKGLFEYNKVVKHRRSRLYTFALYKASWCHYRMGGYKTALKQLGKVIRTSRGGGSGGAVEGTRAVDKLRLAKEAMGDYVNFYEPTGRYKQAYDDFMEISKSEKRTTFMLENLAYRYSYAGNLPASKYLFSQLIAVDPEAPKAAKYQYQIVQDFGSTGRVKDFRNELATWLDQFGKGSGWHDANKGNPKIVKDNFNLQESTLRNHTLQLHQQALNARTGYTKKLAAGSYKMYLSHFKGSKNYHEMRFFYGELLFDLQEFDKAAVQYKAVALNDQKGKYFKQAVENNVLAREKKVPNNQIMEARRQKLKNKLRALPMSPPVKNFEQASLLYLKFFPKGSKALEIKRRLGTIYYAHNQFDKSVKVLRQIVKDKPKSKDAQIAAEIILDIHRLRNDLVAYQAEGKAFLANPAIARSKFGKDLKVNLQKAKFLVADNFSKKGNNLKAAKAFEDFAASNPTSSQSYSALFNSATNYDKTGSTFDAIRMYKKVIGKPGNKPAVLSLKQDARNSLAKIYQKMGQLPEAAKYYEEFGRKTKGSKAAAAINNAALLWDALNSYQRAFKAYNLYAQLGKAREKQDSTWAKAEMYKRQRKYSKSIYQYNKYITMNSPNLKKVIKAHANIAEFHLKMRNISKAKAWYKKIINIVRGSSKARSYGAKYAAQGQYLISKETLTSMRRVRLGRTERSITSGLTKMKAMQKTLVRDMKKVIKYDYGPSVVAALAAEAESNEIIGTTFKNLPVPKEYAKGDVKKQFQGMADKQSGDFLSKAIVSYRAAFNKGISLKAFGPEMLSSAQALYKLDPAGFNQAGEINKVGQLVDMVGI